MNKTQNKCLNQVTRASCSSTLDKRSALIQELVSTERVYVSDLKSVMDHIVDPLMEKANCGKGNEVITVEEISNLFENISVLLGLNSQLLNDLLSKDSSERIGKIFIEFAPFLKMYNTYLSQVEVRQFAHLLLNSYLKFAFYSHYLGNFATLSRIDGKELLVSCIMPSM